LLQKVIHILYGVGALSLIIWAYQKYLN
jgi:hypothetical protein